MNPFELNSAIVFAILFLSLFLIGTAKYRGAMFTAVAILTFVSGVLPIPVLELFSVFVSFGSLLCAWAIGKRLPGADPKRAKRLMILGAICVFSPLLLYKVLVLIIPEAFVSAVRRNIPEFTAGALIPIGMSYFSFRAMAYLFEIYRGKLEPTTMFRFLHYALFWPTLMAGPIERPGRFLEQSESMQPPEKDEIAYGLYRTASGFLKKVVLSAIFFHLAQGYIELTPKDFSGGLQRFQTPYLWFCITAYYFYLYFDFAGYSDLAIGVSRMLGFRIMENFRYPILATNISDFWRRWHISLTSWVTDYIYISLGGNRHGAKKAARYTLVAMIVIGLWHGLEIHFLLWGAWHGFFLNLYRRWRTEWKHRPWAQRLDSLPGRVLAWFVTFQIVNLGWVLFIHDTRDALRIWARLFGLW